MYPSIAAEHIFSGSKVVIFVLTKRTNEVNIPEPPIHLSATKDATMVWEKLGEEAHLEWVPFNQKNGGKERCQLFSANRDFSEEGTILHSSINFYSLVPDQLVFGHQK